MPRLDEPEKNWKFSAADVREREYWSEYMGRVRGSDPAPRRSRAVVRRAADNKWFTRLVVAAAVVEALETLDLAYPKIDAAKEKELEERA